MTLHNTTEFSKKFGVGTAIGIGVIIGLVIVFNIGVLIKNILLPPKIDPANVLLGRLPQIQFPQSTVNGNFAYSLNTVDGNLPSNFPDRLIVYPMLVPQPNLLNLKTVQGKVQTLGFVDQTGNALPQIPRGGSYYEWDEPSGIQRKIVYDTVSLNFNMTSNYLASLDVLAGKNISDQTSAFSTVQNFLTSIDSLPTDLDSNLTTAPDPANDYTVAPQLYSIDSSTGKLVKTTNLQDTRVIRVDLYQQPIQYSLTAGIDGQLTHFQNFDMSLPIMYPNTPASTMEFDVASGANQAQVMKANYYHEAVDLSSNSTPDKLATYPIKSAAQAFEELKSGKGYVASYNGTDNQILINKVYLAYFNSDKTQQYLMPVVVFEGQNGFFGYVSAVDDSMLQ
ncbi:MAG: hypothetical protein ACR2LN_07045 [Candidatus Levyibacteriota bacterium]